jgi:histidinol dehydrogenase
MQIYRYPSAAAERRLQTVLNRRRGFRKKDIAAVARIIEAVRREQDAAVVAYSRRFDAPGMTADKLQVGEAEMKAAGRRVEPAFKRALNRAARQIEDFHRKQRQRSWIQAERPGALLGQLVTPVDAAGVYVPGGKGGATPLVSSVLMGVIPAKIAGVPRVVMTTPPTAEGGVSPYLLAAARRAGVDSVFRVGSAWAIAALAYGTQTIPAVDMIVGPGNIYVTIAKKLVAGIVGIDMLAGPSEIMVVADRHVNPDWVAADLLSQAEHDVLAASILVTDAREVARAVTEAVARRCGTLPRCEIAASSLKRYGAALVVTDIAAALELVNRVAPEHLELLVREPLDHLGRLRHAGAVFLGPYTPEPVGDYMAGPNHVLPTAGTARFSSALSVEHFIKKTSIVRYSAARFRQEASDVIRLAEIEGLQAHADAVRVRLP